VQARHHPSGVGCAAKRRDTLHAHSGWTEETCKAEKGTRDTGTGREEGVTHPRRSRAPPPSTADRLLFEPARRGGNAAAPRRTGGDSVAAVGDVLGAARVSAAPHAVAWALTDISWNAAAACVGAPPPPGAAAGAALLPAACESAALRPRRCRAPRQPRVRAVLLCKVPGCDVRLKALGGYYVRNRLCEEHIRAEVLRFAPGDDLSGVDARFCQKCARARCCALLRPLRAPGWMHGR
jgi:hypothetical protein